MTDLELAAYIIDTFEAGSPPGVVTEAPADFGGVTRWGITQGYLAEYRRVAAVPRDAVRALRRDEAIDALVEMEFRRRGLWQVPDWRPRLVAADFNFHAGADDGTPTLQRVLGVAPDGVVGPRTLAALAAADPVTVAVRVVAERPRFHARKSNGGLRCETCGLPSQKQWLGGWVNRCAALLDRVSG
jgi:lysozyme family protein